MRFFRSAPFSGASAIAVADVRRDRRIPVPEHALPPGGARAVSAPRGPVPAADGGDDRRSSRRSRGGSSASRGARLPIAVAGGGDLTAAGLMLTSISATTPFSLPAGRLRPVRNRRRAGQPADHEHGGHRHARRPGRRRLGRRVDQPPGRDDARRRRDRRGQRRRDHRRDRRRASRRRPTPAGGSSPALGVAILAIGLLTTGRWAKRTARRAAEAFPDLQPPAPTASACPPLSSPDRSRAQLRDQRSVRRERRLGAVVVAQQPVRGERHSDQRARTGRGRVAEVEPAVVGDVERARVLRGRR